ncbi:MAG: hypothetical protein ABWW69_06105, partial [Pyrodictiaceae archaeon]
ENAIKSILEPSDCKGLSSCIGFLKAPHLIPETASLKLVLKIKTPSQSTRITANIRFEAYGEIQGVHGLVSKVLHASYGLTDVYIVIHPPSLRPMLGTVAYHELLIYYLSMLFKQLRPSERLSLTALMASGYNFDILEKLSSDQGLALLERAIVDLYLLAENYSTLNSSITSQGLPVEVKLIPGVQLVWLGPIIMAIAVIFSSFLTRRLHG